MAIETKRKRIWLYIAMVLWGAVGFMSLLPVGFFVLFLDSSLGGVESLGMGVLYYFLLYGVISIPIVCIGSSLGIWFLKDKNKELAFYVSLLPALSLILIFAIRTWANISA